MKTNPNVIAHFDRAINYLLILFGLTATVSISLSEIGFFGAFFVWLMKLAYTQKLDLKRTPADIPLAIFTVLTLIAVFIGLEGSNEIRNRLKPLSLMLMFPLIVNTVKDRKTASKLLLCLLFSVLVQSVIIIFKGLTTKDLSMGIGVGGTMSVTLTAGEMLVTLLGTALCFLFMDKDRKVRAFAFAVFLLGVLALVFTLARGAWIAFIAVLLVFAALRSKTMLVGVTLILVLVFSGSYYYKDTVFVKKLNSVFELEKGTTPQRFAMWRSGLRMVKDHPLGIGIDSVFRKYKEYREPAETNQDRGHLHNNYLQLAVERGVLALLTFLWFLYVVLKTAYLNYLKNTNNKIKALFLSSFLALLAFLVTGVFEYGLGSAIYAPIFWFFAALAVIMPVIPNGKEL